MQENKSNQLSVILTEQLNLPSVSDALPPDTNKARLVQNFIALYNDSDQLSNIPNSKLVPGFLKGCYLGLDFFNHECYLIPYGDRVNFQIDYKGMIKLIKKYSQTPVADIYAKMVREGDLFEEGIKDNKPYINFAPKPFNDGKFLGAFAVCQFKDGTIKYETMSMSQLDTVKHLSKTQNSLSWNKFSEEMYKKTVIRRLCKSITLDFDNAKVAEAFRDDGAIDNDKIIDVTPVENPFSKEAENGA